MTIGDFLVKAVVMAILLATLNWFFHATWRARLWAMWWWMVVVGLGWWWFYFYE